MTIEIQYSASQLLGQYWAMEPEALADLLARLQDNIAYLSRGGEVTTMEAPSIAGRREGSTSVIEIHGPILRHDSFIARFLGLSSQENLAAQIGEALANSSIQEIRFDIDSPGGVVAGLSEFARFVHSASATKPITSFISGMGTSAAYWIAAATQRIEVADTGIAGSIGIAGSFQKPDTDKIEIVSSQSPNKRLDPTTEHGRAQLVKTLDALAEVFIDAVSQYRSMDVSKILAIKGGVLVGQQAIDAGLADSMGGGMPGSAGNAHASSHQAAPQQIQSIEAPITMNPLAPVAPAHASDAQLRTQYQGSAALQAEFSTENIFLAFTKGCRNHTTALSLEQPAPTSVEQPLPSAEALVAEWGASAELQAEFSSAVIYASYRQGERDFNVRIKG